MGKEVFMGATVRRRSAAHGTEVSTSGVGICFDNAVVESFWGKVKAAMVYHHRFTIEVQARAVVFGYIEVFYNRKRLHAALVCLRPEQFEPRWAG